MSRSADRRQAARVERFKREKVRPGPFRLAFIRLTDSIEEASGTPWAFALAVLVVVAWLLTGPFFNFDSTWLLLINTVTTIATFIMVFVIQATQNRDAKAMQLKLDELIRAVPEARNEFMEAEDEDLHEILREKEIVARADPAPPEDDHREKQKAR